MIVLGQLMSCTKHIKCETDAMEHESGGIEARRSSRLGSTMPEQQLNCSAAYMKRSTAELRVLPPINGLHKFRLECLRRIVLSRTTC